MRDDAVVVAIPARNEAQNIDACLDALASQPDASRLLCGVILLANNCTDDTASRARNRAQSLPCTLEIIETNLAPEDSCIGAVRQAACSLAHDLLNRNGHSDGIIVSTDADSRVGERWLEELVAAFSEGIDAVAGSIDLDKGNAAGFDRIEHVRSMEADYANTIAELSSILDFRPHDPWPNHIWAWGANFGIRASVLHTVGGFPSVNLAEDRALHAMLIRHDARIRHSRDVRVWTSSRENGRTPGGFADLLKEYRDDDDALCDFALEPARVAFKRAFYRGRARKLWSEGQLSGLAELTEKLGSSATSDGAFGEFWSNVESDSSALAPTRLPVRLLQNETRQLRQLINHFSADVSAMEWDDLWLEQSNIA